MALQKWDDNSRFFLSKMGKSVSSKYYFDIKSPYLHWKKLSVVALNVLICLFLTWPNLSSLKSLQHLMSVVDTKTILRSRVK
jgi:hypothetical protein